MEPYMEKSHTRCSLNGLRPEDTFSTKIIEGEELHEKLELNRELILTAAPFLKHLYDFVRGSNFFLILNDDEGCILKLIGDRGILDEARGLRMIPGCYMDEKHMGTNAMGLVLSEGKPLQLSGEDHYNIAYHRWTCSAAPIKDSSGKIIGIIDLTGYRGNVHPHTLGMVIAAANAVERMLEIKSYNLELEISKKRIETIFDSISQGILSSDLEGNIITVNGQAAKMFGWSVFEIKEMKICELITDCSDVVDRLKAGEDFTEEDVYVNAKVNKLKYSLTAYPVYDSEKKIKEIVYVLNDLVKARKLAEKILRGQAIYTFDKIIGRDREFIKTVDYAKKIADSRSTVLITGESGTGKEIFAQSIHNYSTRGDKPFIAVNCGAIPGTLIESELFGYEDGAFTGARKGGNPGKFEFADGGTIFLDEIGEMPPDMQIKLLRVIEEGVINRIGGSRQIPVNVRIIAATHKDLRVEVEKGSFRKDLFYRLNVIPIRLPPLRERRDDIPVLVKYYMDKISKRLNKHCVYISQEYMNYLQNYDWPGNIRELENLIEYMINTEAVQFNLWNRQIEVQSPAAEIEPFLSLEQVERQHIVKILKEVGGNITLAAKILCIGRNTLYRKLDKLNIDCSEFEQRSEMEQSL